MAVLGTMPQVPAFTCATQETVAGVPGAWSVRLQITMPPETVPAGDEET